MFIICHVILIQFCLGDVYLKNKLNKIRCLSDRYHFSWSVSRLLEKTKHYHLNFNSIVLKEVLFYSYMTIILCSTELKNTQIMEDINEVCTVMGDGVLIKLSMSTAAR